jgi:hypothetical protein
MTQLKYQSEDFTYDAAHDPSGMPARVAIFADRAGMREEIAEDLAGAGFRTVDGGPIINLLEGQVSLLGDVVMVDCPVLDAANLAALARLDMRAASAGAQLIVSTSIDALDDVFGALDQSQPQILVQPSRAERIVAVGRALAGIGNACAREMTEDDRLNLLHLSRQVEAIAHKLEGLTENPGGAARSQDVLRSHAQSARNSAGNTARQPDTAAPARLFNSARAAMPDPRAVRRVIAGRQARARFFDGAMFADPAWDMLLDLTAAHAEHARVSVTSLCIAAAVPATTALRWLKQMVESGIFVRVADSSDKRRAFIALSDHSVEAMSRYFAEVETPLARAA